ncbi:MAG: biosynthetic-type acetolactate synthase large subunit [Candidatus Methylomirabilis sp.]|nr:biosynthetic-type acetolactate synthase large subunit [Deltaproteobacteria bacterium]
MTTQSEQFKGAEIFVKCLEAEGVAHIFGYPGGAVLDIYDAIYRFGTVKHYLVRHEQAAVHAADGYARATGKVGVALVTSGPGATNAITGLATSYMDSTPIVVFSGQVPVHLIGNDAFQEADTVGISRPCTKHNYLVKDVRDLARVVKEAFHIARSGRPGPVLVDIPKNVSQALHVFSYPEKANIPGYNPTVSGHPKQIEKAVEMMMAAERPIIYTGGGVTQSDAQPELVELVEMTTFPCTNTLMGLGGLPGDHPRFVGMLGMHGTYWANMTISHSDLIVAVGARFDDRVTGKIETFAPKAKIVHVDIDPSSISKNIKVHVPIVGDCKRVLRQLIDAFKKGERHKALPERTAPWWARIKEWEAKAPLAKPRVDRGDTIDPVEMVQAIDEVTGCDAILTTEVGQHQMWAAQYNKIMRPRDWITSGGLGTMGFGFPSAMGASVARPDRTVICIAGDASIQMNIQELATCAQYGIPVKIFIMNNLYQGMVRQWQELIYGKRYSEVLTPGPDYVKLADAYGLKGFQVSKRSELRSVLKEAIATPGCVIVDVLVAEEDNVFPMVPAGKGLTDMLLA